MRKHHPDWEIYCVCTVPGDTSTRYGIPAFPIHSISSNHNILLGKSSPITKSVKKIFYHIKNELAHWIKMYRTLKGSQMVIAPGTGLLTDFRGDIYGRCYETFKLSILAKFCGCKLMFVSIGAGPIRHPVNRWFVKSALSRADYRSYRNNSSKKYMEDIGFKSSNDPIYPDLAFSLPKIVIPECRAKDRQRPVIGVGVADGIVGVMAYNGKSNFTERSEIIYREYIDKICSFVTWLLEHKYIVRILMGDTEHDSIPKEELKNQLTKRGYNYEDGNIFDEPITSVDHLLSQVAATDVVISPRFHNIILALMLNKPVISISYHDKFSSLMAEMGLENYCLHTTDLNIEELIELFKKLMANADEIKQQIETNIKDNVLALEKQYSILFNNVPIV